MTRHDSKWYQASIWLVYAMMGMLVPVVVGVIVLGAMRMPITIGSFTNGGQFAVYSAGMLMTTAYTVARPTTLRLRKTELFALVCVAGLVLSLPLFVIGLLIGNGESIDTRWIQWPSIGLFGASCIIALLAVAFDSERTSFHPAESRQADQTSLEDQFDQTTSERKDR